MLFSHISITILQPEQIIITKTPSPDLAKEQELEELREEVDVLQENIENLNENLNEKDNIIAELSTLSQCFESLLSQHNRNMMNL